MKSLSIIIISLLLDFGSPAGLRLNVGGVPPAFGVASSQKKSRMVGGEDAWSLTPLTLAVADGVGRSKVNSKLMSTVLVSEFDSWIWGLLRDGKAKFNNHVDYKSKLQDQLSKATKSVRTNLLTLFNQWVAASKGAQGVNEDDIHTGATVATAFLHTQGANTRIRLFSRGDSQMMLWRKVAAREAPELFYFKPFLVTPAKQREFNFPAQYSTYSEVHSDDDNWSDATKVEAGNLVLGATDGFWDNIHPGFLQMLVNGLAIQFQDTPEDIGTWTLQAVDVYACLVERHHNFLRETFFSYQIDPKLEQSDSGRRQAFPEIFPSQVCSSSHNINSKSGLAQWIQEFTEPFGSASGVSTTLLAMFREFLGCPILEMIDVDGYAFAQRDPLVHSSSCLDRVFQKHVRMTEESVIDFSRRLTSGELSGILGKVALRFSEMSQFPSQFFLNAWRAGKFEGRAGSGKTDDITVIFAGLVPQETDFAPATDDYLTEATRGKAWVDGQLKGELYQALNSLSADPRLYI